MNLVQLKYFHAVYTYRAVSTAAEFLHITQPSLSTAIKELEREFGVPLFHRHHRGMMPTSAGDTLYTMCQDLLGRAEQIENVMHDLGDERKKLRLGVPPMIGSLLLPDIYKGFMSAHPEVQLEITERGRQTVAKMLSEGYLDMVFLPHNKPLDDSFSSLVVAKLEIACCTVRGNFLDGLDCVTPKSLQNIPLVLFENSFFQTEEIKKWFALESVKPDILLQTSQLSTMLSMISKRIAVGFMFKNLIDTDENLVAIPMETPLFVDVSLVWKKENYFFDCMKQFKSFAQKDLLL